MANLIHKILKQNSSIRAIARVDAPHLPKLTPPVIAQQKSGSNDCESVINVETSPFTNPVMTMKGNDSHTLRFFPSFPFGYCLDPVSSYGSGTVETMVGEHDAESEDSGMVYADSVKKKRKKKMNKHKYRKLRKRLGRQT